MIYSWRVNKLRASLTSAEGEKVGLVGISLQQRRHAAGHALVAFVDEFLAEVVVYLLGCDAVVSWQGAVDELRQLKMRNWILITNDLKISSLEWAGMLVVKITWWIRSSTLSDLFIYLINVDQKSYKRGKDAVSNCWVSFQAAAACVCGWLSGLMCLHLCEPEGANVCLIALWFIRSHTHRDRGSWTESSRACFSEDEWVLLATWWVLRRSHTYSNTDILICLYSLCLNTFFV